MRVKIKEVRKKFGDTLQSLAAKIDYDYSNLSKIERGLYKPSIELLYKIASTYNISIYELLIDDSELSSINLEDSETSLFLDNEKISKEELLFLIQCIRIFRQAIKKDNPIK